MTRCFCLISALAVLAAEHQCASGSPGQCTEEAGDRSGIFHGVAAEAEYERLKIGPAERDRPPPPLHAALVKFESIFPTAVELVWMDVESGDETSLETLEPNAPSAHETMTNHVFLVKSASSQSILALFRVPHGSKHQVVVIGSEDSCFVHKNEQLKARDATTMRNAEKDFIQKRNITARQDVYTSLLPPADDNIGLYNLVLARLAETHLLLGNTSVAKAMLEEAVSAGGRTSHYLLAAQLFIEHGRQLRLRPANTEVAAETAVVKTAAVAEQLRSSSSLSRRASVLARCAVGADEMGPSQLMVAYKHLLGDFADGSLASSGIARHPLDTEDDNGQQDPEEILEAFYLKHQPGKVSTAALTLAKFKGKLSSLDVLLRQKYGVAPSWGKKENAVAYSESKNGELKLNEEEGAMLRCDASLPYYKQASSEVLAKERKTSRVIEVPPSRY
jgi:hypothetical protein